MINTLFPHLQDWQLDGVRIEADQFVLELSPPWATASCPVCGQEADRIHSRYVRRLADLPVAGRPLRLLLRVRRFFCDVAGCARVIFCERLAGLAAAHARRSAALQNGLREIGAALGGRPGAVLAEHLAMPASRMTLLRLLHALLIPAQPTPRVLGVDEWAWRKGRVYGTILVDLERGEPVDLLPEHTADAVADWLVQHPGVQVISRDRDGVLAQGARRGAPEAVQTADRWHLAKNLAEALVRVLDRHAALLRQGANAAAVEQGERPTGAADAGGPAPSAAPIPPGQETLGLADQERRQTKRLARQAEILALHQQGLSLREVARRTGLARDTVRRYAQTEPSPERPSRRRRTLLDAHLPYLLERWNAGCRGGEALWRELRARGFVGSRSVVARYLAQLRRAQGLPSGRQHAVKHVTAHDANVGAAIFLLVLACAALTLRVAASSAFGLGVLSA